jgi:hypothetical protein
MQAKVASRKATSFLDSLGNLWPVLSAAEREQVVARARLKLFELLRYAGVEVTDENWPVLEEGLRLRIAATPDMERRFWWSPEEVIAEVLTSNTLPSEIVFPNEVRN